MAKKSTISPRDAAIDEHVYRPTGQHFDSFYHWPQYGPPTRNQAIISHLAWTWQTYAYKAQSAPPNAASTRSHFIQHASIALEAMMRHEKLPAHIDSWNAVLALRIIADEMDGSSNRYTAALRIRSYAVYLVNLTRTVSALSDISVKEAYHIVFDAMDKNCHDICRAKSVNTLKSWDVQKDNPNSKSPVEQVSPLEVELSGREHYEEYVWKMMSILGTLYSHHRQSKG